MVAVVTGVGVAPNLERISSPSPLEPVTKCNSPTGSGKTRWMCLGLEVEWEIRVERGNCWTGVWGGGGEVRAV